MMKNTKIKKKNVGILGYGEIGQAMEKLCEDAGYEVLVRELEYDQIEGNKIEVLHVNISQKEGNGFVDIVAKNIKEIRPQLTIINSSVTPGTTRKIFRKTKLPIVHSPVIGLHPHLYDSIKNHFPKTIGPIDKKSERLGKAHLKKLGLEMVVFKKPEETEAAKLLSLVYYAWNIIFCKWMDGYAKDNKLDFGNIYTKWNEIYNNGYADLLPNVIRPVMIPQKGPIGGHCIIPDTVLIDDMYDNDLTKFVMKMNKQFEKEINDTKRARKEYIKLRDKMISKVNK